MKDKIPLVSVICTTYNHEPYIRQALDGFVMQQCSFPIEIIVHDDASTDKTADIIREYAEKYPDLIRPILQTENQHSQGIDISKLLYVDTARGKYCALCEGDDYWTDPLKLQKQVDFLEANLDYGMVYTKIKRYIQHKKKFKGTFGKDYVSFENLLQRNVIPTLSVIINKNLLIQYYQDIKPEEKSWLVGDYPIWLWFSLKSHIYYLNEITGVYRVLEESASHSKDINKMELFIDSSVNVGIYFLHYAKYPIDVLKIETNRCLLKAHVAMKNGNAKRAKELFLASPKLTFTNRIKLLVCNNKILFWLFRIFLELKNNFIR